MPPSWSDLQSCLGIEIPSVVSTAIDALGASLFWPDLGRELETSHEELLRITLNWRRTTGFPPNALWIGTDLWCETLNLVRVAAGDAVLETWRKVPYDRVELSAAEPFADWLAARTRWLSDADRSPAAVRLRSIEALATRLGGVVTPSWGFGIPGLRISNKASHPGLRFGFGVDLVLIADHQGGYRSESPDSVSELVGTWLESHKADIAWSPKWKSLAASHGFVPLDHEQLPRAARELKAEALASG